MDELTVTQIDACLLRLAQNYKKLNKKTAIPFEIIVVGGASILLNYGFRQSTQDIDAYIEIRNQLKDAIRLTEEELSLSVDWLNQDFLRTASFSERIALYSKFYKTYAGIMTVRTVTSEYLIAMKIMSGRAYKRDRSDIIGVLVSEPSIRKEDVLRAFHDLYPKCPIEQAPGYAWFVSICQGPATKELYDEVKKIENRVRSELKTKPLGQ